MITTAGARGVHKHSGVKTVWSLIAARRRGVSDQELLQYSVTPLALADLDATGAYYEQHVDEIETDIVQNERL